MQYIYNTKGTCSKAIVFDIDDAGIIQSVEFVGGCMGNTSGIAALVAGMHVDEVVRRLKGITCGSKGTSCPDQLAAALQATFGK